MKLTRTTTTVHRTDVTLSDDDVAKAVAWYLHTYHQLLVEEDDVHFDCGDGFLKGATVTHRQELETPPETEKS